MSVNFDDFECAGHRFVNGRCVSYTTRDGENVICGQEWLSIQYATTADVNKQGIAHTGGLTRSEADEIETRKAAFDERWTINLGWRAK